jgi:hypothetical protein
VICHGLPQPRAQTGRSSARPCGSPVPARGLRLPGNP